VEISNRISSLEIVPEVKLDSISSNRETEIGTAGMNTPYLSSPFNHVLGGGLSKPKACNIDLMIQILESGSNASGFLDRSAK
jgi:hypothetical protein